MATLYGFLAIMMWGTLAHLDSYTKAIPAFHKWPTCLKRSSTN